MVSQNFGLNMLRDITELQFVANVVATIQNTIQIADVSNLPNALATVNSNIANAASSLNATNNTVTPTNSNLATHQNQLTIQTTGAGAPAIDALNSVRNICGVAPVEVLLYVDPFSPNEPMNNNSSYLLIILYQT